MSLSTAHAKHAPVYTEAPAPQPSHKAPARKRRIDPAVYISALAVLVLAAALLQVGQRARLAMLTYDLHNAKSRLEQLERVQTQLLVEVEEARSLSRIDLEARSRLGMVRPQATEWVVVRPRESAPVPADPPAGGWADTLFSWYDRLSTGIRAALQ